MKKLRIEELQTKTVLLQWRKRGLMYTSTGYGSKIPTDKMVFYSGRWRRVYCRRYSNCGTCYIISKGEKIIID